MLDSEDPRTEAIRHSFKSDRESMVETKSGKSKNLNQRSINVYKIVFNPHILILSLQ